MSLSVGIIIPNMMGKTKFMFQTTNQYTVGHGYTLNPLLAHQLLGLLDGHLGIMDIGLVVKDKILMIDLGT